MVVLRRLTALVVLVVTFVLVLVESGFACSPAGMDEMHASAPSGSAATDEVASMPTANMPMASMPMPDTPMAGVTDAPTPTSDDHGDAPEQAPCRFPWAPAGCRDMAPCAPTALAVAAAPVAEPMPPHDAVMLERVRVPRSVETAPETPPPRA